MVGCSNYPECKFAAWAQPEHVPCYRCKLPFLLIEDNGVRRCIDPDCRQGAAIEEVDPNGVIEDLLRYVFRTHSHRAEVARLLAIAGGVACGAFGLTEEDASQAFVAGIALGAKSTPKKRTSISETAVR